MNTLSWLLYAADLAGSLSTVLTLVAFGAGLAGTVTVVARAMRRDFDGDGPVWEGGWAVSKGFYRVAIIAALIAAIVPGKDTIYAIAASEVGEEALKSETAGKAVKALNAWLDQQIAPEKQD